MSHTDETLLTSKKYFGYGDILFAITGESVEDIAKCCAYIGHETCLAGGDIVVLKHNEDPKYLAYALSTMDAQRQKSKGKVKSKVVHSSVPDIKAIKVPIPPLPVQREIVRILDNFTEITQKLTGELEAELTARKQQYEYYRNRLLTFDVHGGGGQVEPNGGRLAKPVFSKLVKRLMPRVFLRKRRWNTASPATEETDCVDMCAKQTRKEKNHLLVGRVLYAGMFALQKAIIMLRNTLLL